MIQHKTPTEELEAAFPDAQTFERQFKSWFERYAMMRTQFVEVTGHVRSAKQMMVRFGDELLALLPDEDTGDGWSKAYREDCQESWNQRRAQILRMGRHGDASALAPHSEITSIESLLERVLTYHTRRAVQEALKFREAQDRAALRDNIDLLLNKALTARGIEPRTAEDRFDAIQRLVWEADSFRAALATSLTPKGAPHE